MPNRDDLAVELGLDKETRQRIGMAAMVHDVGKLAIAWNCSMSRAG